MAPPGVAQEPVNPEVWAREDERRRRNPARNRGLIIQGFLAPLRVPNLSSKSWMNEEDAKILFSKGSSGLEGELYVYIYSDFLKTA